MTTKFSIEKLLDFENEFFIKQAYKKIIRREPNSDELKNWFKLIKSNKKDKIELLWSLRNMEEANENLDYERLKRRYKIFCYRQTVYKIPIIGKVFQIIKSILKIKETEKKIKDNLIDIIIIKENLEFYVKEIKEKQNKDKNNLEKNIEENSSQVNKIDESVKDINKLIKKNSDKLSIQKKNINHNKIDILGLQENIKKITKVKGAKIGIDKKDSGSKKEKEVDHNLDSFYISFENQFRGKREDVKQRIKPYLKIIKKYEEKKANKINVLDLGCGRGEWLGLLKENGISAKGVDTNALMVKICKKHGLEVILEDAIKYLKKQKQKSIDVVTGFHIIEHFSLNGMFGLLDLIYKTLIPGGFMILETPNPENLITGACNFYMDPTHDNPIPPALLKFIVEYRGFVDLEIKRLNENQLGKIKDVQLQNLLYGPQDYSIIGYKIFKNKEG